MESLCPGEEDLLPVALGDPPSPELQEHLEQCSACRERLARLLGEVSSVRGAVKDLPPLPSSERWTSAPADRPLATTGADSPAVPPADGAERSLNSTGAHPLPQAVPLTDGQEENPSLFQSPPTQPPANDEAGDHSVLGSGREDPEAHPERFGRYRVTGVLGSGGFGIVFKGRDEQLLRDVAIKVPLRAPDRSEGEADVYLAEARTLAGLDHPGIVPVYDVGLTDDGRCYLVSKFIEGTDLSARIKQGRLPLPEAVQLIAQVAEALHHAHRRRLVHRDIKPANILLDRQGQPYLADFGLALREEDFGTGWRFAGTLAYMSPEQARGEGHRVDARSDVFSLGVVFYECLTGRRPFPGKTATELRSQIRQVEPRPPRQLDDLIPKELDRICLKALSKRATERYSTAIDLAEDLRHWSAAAQPVTTVPLGPAPADSPAEPPPPPSDTSARPVPVVPKGLRSFDAQDSDFFLALVPGPRDRDGMPDGLRFWKTRIEETDPDKTFSVGLLYGPSGCGKSSLVKAGLLPRLDRAVLPVYVEATGDDTEARLLRGLRKVLPDWPDRMELSTTLAHLRRGHEALRGKKVLIILDQFEQWLHAQREDAEPELVRALRQCDGRNVQAVVLVRDDFWMAITRFMRDLEIRLVEGQNSAAVDLFDPTHARKVLSWFGQSYGRLPERRDELSAEQNRFLDQAVAGLARDGSIVPIRLSLFAEMIKGKPWTLGTLKRVGGAEGIGVAFLEDTFSSQTAAPGHRLHQKAARSVLKALLPEQGSEIKGHMRSREELLEASGYADRPRDFEGLMQVLDPELRLVTPTDPEGQSAENATAERRYYQLTHDFLVPSLRLWLTRKQRETRRGRAELRLAERAADWTARPESRHLPVLWEWLFILLWTRHRDWLDSQRLMMRSATRFYTLRAGLAGLLLASIGWISFETYEYQRTASMVDALGRADVDEVRPYIDLLKNHRKYAIPMLERMRRTAHADLMKWRDTALAAGGDDSQQIPIVGRRIEVLRRELSQAHEEEIPGQIRTLMRLRSSRDRDQEAGIYEKVKNDLRTWHYTSLALVPMGRVKPEELSAWLLSASPVELKEVCAILSPYKVRLLDSLWKELKDKPAQNTLNDRCLQAASSLAYFDERANPAWSQVGKRVIARLIREDSLLVRQWTDALRPIRNALIGPLTRTFFESKKADERKVTFDILMDYAADRTDVLAELVLRSDESQFQTLMPRIYESPEKAVPIFLQELNAKPPSKPAAQPEAQRDELAARQANAALALLILNRADSVWPLFRQSDDPRVRTELIHRLSPMGIDPQILIDRLLRGETDVSARRALILGLHGYFQESSTGRDNALRDWLMSAYRNDPDPGIHSAVEWLLPRRAPGEKLGSIDTELAARDPVPGAGWYVNRHGHTMAIVRGPVTFVMGSPAGEVVRPTDVIAHNQTIDHSFAIATKETTQAQFGEFLQTQSDLPPEFHLGPSDVNLPMASVTWYQAARYCRWLSEQEGMAEDQMCYPPLAEIREGMKLPADYLKRTGYRLPTEAEWEYACRSGTTTTRFYGDATDLLYRYAWYEENSKRRAREVGRLQPNDLGLFDVLGNVWEWCQDRYDASPTGPADKAALDSAPVADTDTFVARGGSFLNSPSFVRSAHRNWFAPGSLDITLGVRVARTLP